MAAVYTKDELVALYPCFACLTKSEKMAVLVYVLIRTEQRRPDNRLADDDGRCRVLQLPD